MADTPSTRDRLLQEATRLFLAQGYAATSMDQVRQAAGASNGSLYHHFPTKAALADALYLDLVHGFHAAILAVIAREAVAEAGVKGLVRAYVTWVLKHPDEATLLHRLRREGDITDASAAIGAANRETFAALGAWVQGRVAAGEMRDLPFALWMPLVFAPSFSLTGRWVQEGAAAVPPRTRAALEHAAWMAVAP